jgi:hypothetical protein
VLRAEKGGRLTENGIFSVRRNNPSMKNSEMFGEYFRRALFDADNRAHQLRSAKYSRSLFGWFTVLFAALAIWQFSYDTISGSPWFSHGLALDVVSLVLYLMIYDKMGERIVVLEVMGESPGRFFEPALSSGASCAAKESRIP